MAVFARRCCENDCAICIGRECVKGLIMISSRARGNRVLIMQAVAGVLMPLKLISVERLQLMCRDLQCVVAFVFQTMKAELLN